MESQTLHIPSSYNQHDIFRFSRREADDPSSVYQHTQPLDVTIYCSRYAASVPPPPPPAAAAVADHQLRRELTPTYLESVLSRHSQTSDNTVPFYRSSDLNCSYGSYESLSSVEEISLPKNSELNFTNSEVSTFPKYDSQSDLAPSMEDLQSYRDSHSSSFVPPNTLTREDTITTTTTNNNNNNSNNNNTNTNRFHQSSFIYPASNNSLIPSTGNYQNKPVLYLTDPKKCFSYPSETRYRLTAQRSSPVFDPDSDCTAKSEEQLIPELHPHADTEPPTSAPELILFKNEVESSENCAETINKNIKRNDNVIKRNDIVNDDDDDDDDNGGDNNNDNDNSNNNNNFSFSLKGRENSREYSRNKESTGKISSCNNVKPALSYIALIATAILESTQQRLSLGSIYSWIETNYPFYRNRSQGWRNSVRHNLSLNECFVKAGRCEDGKGNYWAIHPANIQDFMRGDFRQRRRSRRRGRKTTATDLNGYGISAKYLPSQSTLTMSSFAPALNPIYSPYTEAERQAYRLDEALLRQAINSPFVKWFHGSMSHTSFSAGGIDYKTPSPHWQPYSDKVTPPGPNYSR
ncbi:uncharacterized protein LOC106871145 [Argonauta hians]